MERELDRLDIPYERVGEMGLIAFIGRRGNKTMALRADIDGLEIEEESDKSYRSRRPGPLASPPP